MDEEKDTSSELKENPEDFLCKGGHTEGEMDRGTEEIDYGDEDDCNYDT